MLLAEINRKQSPLPRFIEPEKETKTRPISIIINASTRDFLTPSLSDHPPKISIANVIPPVTKLYISPACESVTFKFSEEYLPKIVNIPK